MLCQQKGVSSFFMFANLVGEKYFTDVILLCISSYERGRASFQRLRTFFVSISLTCLLGATSHFPDGHQAFSHSPGRVLYVLGK